LDEIYGDKSHPDRAEKILIAAILQVVQYVQYVSSLVETILLKVLSPKSNKGTVSVGALHCSENIKLCQFSNAGCLELEKKTGKQQSRFISIAISVINDCTSTFVFGCVLCFVLFCFVLYIAGFQTVIFE